MPDQSPTNDPMAAFGPNEWLVDELYEQYKTDKNSVDKAWWSFFEDYQPAGGDGPNGATVNGTTAAPAQGAPAASAPATAPAQSAPAPVSRLIARPSPVPPYLRLVLPSAC